MKILSLLLILILAIACAHHRDVRPGANGIHRVVIPTDDTEEASRNAIDQANHFCKESNKYAAFISENSKYTKKGMSENSYNTGKTISKVASAGGGAAWVFGDKKTSKIGGATMIGGGVGDQVLGKGYTVEMTFKCQ